MGPAMGPPLDVYEAWAGGLRYVGVCDAGTLAARRRLGWPFLGPGADARVIEGVVLGRGDDGDGRVQCGTAAFEDVHADLEVPDRRIAEFAVRGVDGPSLKRDGGFHVFPQSP